MDELPTLTDYVPPPPWEPPPEWDLSHLLPPEGWTQEGNLAEDY